MSYNKYPDTVIQNILGFSQLYDIKDLFSIRQINHAFHQQANKLALDRKNLKFSPWKTFPRFDNNAPVQSRRKLDELMSVPHIFRNYQANGNEWSLIPLLEDERVDQIKLAEFTRKLAPYITSMSVNLSDTLSADPYLEALPLFDLKNIRTLIVEFHLFYEENKTPITVRNECKLFKKLLNAYENLEFITIDFSPDRCDSDKSKQFLENEFNFGMFKTIPNVNLIFSNIPSIAFLKNFIPEAAGEMINNFTINLTADAYEFNEQQNLGSIRLMSPFVVQLQINYLTGFLPEHNPHFNMNSFSWTKLEKLSLDDRWDNSLEFLRNLPKLRELELDQVDFRNSVLFVNPNRSVEENFISIFENLPSIEEINITAYHNELNGLELVTERMWDQLKAMYQTVNYEIKPIINPEHIGESD